MRSTTRTVSKGEQMSHANSVVPKLILFTSWGYYIGNYLDIPVDNRARNGRSTRRFINEGSWDALLGNTTAGDYVLIEMGKNDEGNITEADRAVLPGIGEDTITVNLTLTPGASEVVHTFGWYLRQMIADVQAIDATPIISSMTPRNYWDSTTAMQSVWDYAEYAAQVAAAEGVVYIDHLNYSIALFEPMGQTVAKTFFPNDNTHTNPRGAELMAVSFVQAVKCAAVEPLSGHLNTNATEVTQPACM